jgi:hypothetical protein
MRQALARTGIKEIAKYGNSHSPRLPGQASGLNLGLANQSNQKEDLVMHATKRRPGNFRRQAEEAQPSSTPLSGGRQRLPVNPEAHVGPFTAEQLAAGLQELNRRLTVVKDRVRGVARGYYPGFYLFGPPGTSKTHTIRTTLSGLGAPYIYHVGHVTPLGLFDLLDQHRDQVIVLDDVSSIFRQPIALQILLAALGNQLRGTGERIVEYRRQGRVEKVQFSGGAIFASNLDLPPAPLLLAIKSRAHYLEHDPSDVQLAALMLEIAGRGWPAESPLLSAAECHEVAAFLIAESARLGCRYDIRLLVDKAFPDFLQWRHGQTEAHWKDLVTTALQEELRALRFSPRALPGTRNERKAREQQIVQDLLAEFPTARARLAAWQDRSGKSARAFYRRLRELGTDYKPTR